MLPPNPILRDGKTLTAWLSELAPKPEDLDVAGRVQALDQVVSGLVMLDDGTMRDLLIEHAAIHIRVTKTQAKRRLAEGLVRYRDIVADQQRAQLAAVPAKPAIERFRDALEARVPAFTYLLHCEAPNPDLLDEQGKLKALDQVIAVLMPLPDPQLQTLYLTQLGEHLGLKEKLVRDRWRVAVAAKTSDPSRNPEVGGEEVDGGFHRAVIATMQRWLVRLKIHPDAVSGWLDDGGKLLSIKTRALINRFHFEHASFFESLPRDRIQITLEAMMATQRDVRRQAILATLIGLPSSTAGREELRKWLVATTHRDDPVDFGVMLHWLWQVKRLNAGMRVAFDMMVILFGKQGKGKSVATEILCRPWLELVLEIDAETIVDRRSTEVLGDYAIGRWEEMSGGSKAEVQKLKQALSAPMLNYRELGGHNHNRIVRRMAFIGTSNNPVRDVIADATGARRFYEIQLDKATDRDALNGLDPLLIWQAVSESDPPPIEAVAEQVAERQRELLHRDSFDYFLDWCESESWARLTISLDDLPVAYNAQRPTLVVPAYTDERGYTLTEVAVLFKHYSRLSNIPPKGDQWIARRLGEAGWEQWRPRISNPTRTRYYRKPARPPVDPADEAGPNRGEKLAAAPSPAEDLFAQGRPLVVSASPGPEMPSIPSPTIPITPPASESPQREPGADEDEPPWMPASDQIPL